MTMIKIIYDGCIHREICPECGKTFECLYEEQTPGFRDNSDKRCPYCGKVLETSMEWEFYTNKLEH